MATNTIDPNTGVDVIRNRYYDDTTVIDGVRYTTKEDPNELTSSDFLELMLEEMKQQDPTKPMDSQRLMDSQLKMSTIESNIKMSEAMESLQASYASSALSTAANLIGNIIEDGSTNETGELSSYTVNTVQNIDGELYANAYEITGIVDGLSNVETQEYVIYDADGFIYESDGETKTDYSVVLSERGRFTYNEDGSLKIVDGDNHVVTDKEKTEYYDEVIAAKYAVSGSAFTYADEATQIPIGNITEVRKIKG
jgi:flagellar basal-body rod modification protein FlgD